MAVVSVIIPSLNVARYIEECIDSARGQTLRDIEIICVDAGSIDGTLEIIERKAKDDSRIRIIKSDRRSYGHQMNLGFAAATGKYVAILESDDFIKSGAYAHFVSLAEKTDADLIKADYYIVLGNGKNRSFRRMETCLNRSDYGRCITPRDCIKVFNARMQTWQGIYRRSFIEKHNIRHNETSGASYQDNGFWFQTMMFADRLVFSPEAFYCLRRDNPASSMLQKGKVFCIFEEYEFIKSILYRHPHLKERLAGIFRKKEADNTRAHFDRIAKENRREYLLRWQTVVRDAFERNEYDRSLFSDNGWRAIETVRDNPEWFFEADSVNDFSGLIKTRGDGKCVRKRTWLERFEDCLSDNGWRYTIRHVFSRIKECFLFDRECKLPIPPPLVSVVIPFCNCEKYAAKTLSDICAQSYGNIEIICVDDGSTDGTAGILETFAKRDTRVKILHQCNGGAGKARNAGLAVAKGEYVAILDADDLYESDMIEKAVKLAHVEKAEIVAWRSDTYNESDGKLPHKWFYNKSEYETLMSYV